MAGKRTSSMLLAPPSRAVRAANSVQVCHIFCQDARPSFYQRLRHLADSLYHYFCPAPLPHISVLQTTCKPETLQINKESEPQKTVKVVGERREAEVQITEEEIDALKVELAPAPADPPKPHHRRRKHHRDEPVWPLKLGSGLVVKDRSAALAKIDRIGRADALQGAEAASEQFLENLRKSSRTTDVHSPTAPDEHCATSLPAPKVVTVVTERATIYGKSVEAVKFSLPDKVDHPADGSPEPMQVAADADDTCASSDQHSDHCGAESLATANSFLSPVAFGSYGFGAQQKTEGQPAPFSLFPLSAANPFLPTNLDKQQVTDAPAVFGSDPAGFALGKVKRRTRS